MLDEISDAIYKGELCKANLEQSERIAAARPNGRRLFET